MKHSGIMVSTIQRALNKENFNFKLAMVKGVPLDPRLFEQICPLKYFEVNLQTPTVISDPHIAYRKAKT